MEYFKRNFMHNIALKVLSVFLAVMCWYFVMGEEVLELNRRLDVRIIVPDGYTLKGGENRTKYVTLRGPRVYLGSIIHQREMNAVIRINNLESKTTRYQLGRSDIIGDLDPRIIVDIIDPLIDVEIGALISKRIPLKEVLRGTPAVGANIHKVVITPPTVRVKGIQKSIANREFIFTELIDVTDLSKTKTFDVALNTTIDGKEYLEVTPNRAKVEVQIGEEQINKIFKDIPILVQGATAGFKLGRQDVDIEIQGSTDVLKAVSRGNLSAFVDVSGLAVGKHEKRVQVKIPVDTTLIQTQPQNVMIDIYTNTKK